MRQPTTTLLTAALIGLLSVPAVAQKNRDADRPQRGQQERLTAEQLEDVWTTQAQTVATSIELSPEASEQLVKTYVDTRENLHEELQAMREARKEARSDKAQGERPDRPRQRRQSARNNPAVQEAKTQLAESLGTFLSQEQTSIAMQSLGRFSRSWDKTVHTVLQFELTEANESSVLASLLDFTTSLQPPAGPDDREAAREAMHEARTELASQLEPILNDEQLMELRKAMRPHRARGPKA